MEGDGRPAQELLLFGSGYPAALWFMNIVTFHEVSVLKLDVLILLVRLT